MTESPDDSQAKRGSESPPPSLLSQLSAYTGIVAPTTLITALLFYFGYLATSSRFEYFGVYLDLVNLSTSDLLLYGSEVVYVPIVLGAFTILAAGGLRLLLHWLVSDPRRDTLSRWTALAVGLLGVLLLVRALVGIIVPTVSEQEVPGASALSMTAGVLFLRGAANLWGRIAARNPHTDWQPPAAILTSARYSTIVIAVAGLFWAANSFSASYGRALAEQDAQSLNNRPAITLETTDPLADLPPGAAKSDLPGRGKFRHRYTGLRLLVESGGHLFLIPAPWDPTTSRTLVLPFNETFRLQLSAGQ